MSKKKNKYILIKLLILKNVIERLYLISHRLREQKQDEFDIPNPNTIIEEYEYPTTDYLEDLNKTL